jgi:hypothetical protein
MKKIILVCAILFPVMAYAQPSIHFQDEIHDFGEVKEGTQLEHVFDFENAGTSDLMISGVKAS